MRLELKRELWQCDKYRHRGKENEPPEYTGKKVPFLPRGIKEDFLKEVTSKKKHLNISPFTKDHLGQML